MPETYISEVAVDLWSQTLTLSWVGPEASDRPQGPFLCSPGKGVVSRDCDNLDTSRQANTNCTPKGRWFVLDHYRRFPAYPEAEWVTLFQSLSRGIALHYYPIVPPYPASHGCVRIADYETAKLIWANTKAQVSRVNVKDELRPPLIVLRHGDRSVAVRKMQRRLQEQGYTLSVDGVFGSSTEAVLKQFQNDAALSGIDGVFGPATYTVLFSNVGIPARV